MDNLENGKAEQIILGVLILNNDYFDKINFLQSHYFYDSINQVIFEHISELIKANKKADSITLKGFFNKEIEELYEYSAEEYAKLEVEKKPQRKGLNYLSILMSMGAGIVDIYDYAKIIQDLYKKRETLNVCKNFYKNIQNEVNKTKANDLIERLRLEIDKIEDKSGFEYNIQPALNILTERYFEIKESVENNKSFNNEILKTGLYDFDEKFNGLTKGELVILAGCSSMGKTTVANQIALNVAEMGNNCIFFSLETGNKQFANKILANKCRINSTRLTHNKAYSEEISKLENKCKEFEKVNYFIDDTYGIDCGYINKCLKRFVRKYEKIDLIVVDYLQIMRDTEKNNRFNRTREIGNITNGLKEIAKKFNCVVICLSQLSRSVEARENHKPILRDLRDSGEIEQIADIVLFCYREYYYKVRARNCFNKDISEEKIKLDSLNSYLKSIYNKCELNVAKNRNGRWGDIEINFEPKFSLVNDIDINKGYNSNWRGDN